MFDWFCSQGGDYNRSAASEDRLLIMPKSYISIWLVFWSGRRLPAIEKARKCFVSLTLNLTKHFGFVCLSQSEKVRNQITDVLVAEFVLVGRH